MRIIESIEPSGFLLINSVMCIYLLVKTHNKTGLRYLCKTIKKDYHRYTGSGYVWKDHLKKYGVDYTTTLIRECKNQQELYYWGKYYSQLWHITSAVDNFGNRIWANMIPETGGGACYGDLNCSRNPQVKARKIMNATGKKQPNISKGVKKSWKSADRKQKQHQATSGNKHYTKSPNYQFKHSVARQKAYDSNCDQNVYVWNNIDTDEILQLTRREFAKITGANRGAIYKVISGKNTHVKRWKLIK